MSRKKSTTKATGQKDGNNISRTYLENLRKLRKTNQKIISNQLNIEQFTPEELKLALRKILNRKAAELYEIGPEVWKTREFDDILLRYCNAVYNQNIIDRWTNGSIHPKKDDLVIAKN